MRRKDPLPQVAVAAFVACLTGCLSLPLAPADAPTPDRPEPAGPGFVEVVWDNRSEDAFVVSVVGAEPDQQAFAFVEPCSSQNVIQLVDPPFEIGLGQKDHFVLEPMPTVVHSSELDEPTDGVYRVHLSIGPDGTLSEQPLKEFPSSEPPRGIC